MASPRSARQAKDEVYVEKLEEQVREMDRYSAGQNKQVQFFTVAHCRCNAALANAAAFGHRVSIRNYHEAVHI